MFLKSQWIQRFQVGQRARRERRRSPIRGAVAVGMQAGVTLELSPRRLQLLPSLVAMVVLSLVVANLQLCHSLCAGGTRGVVPWSSNIQSADGQEHSEGGQMVEMGTTQPVCS